MKDEPKREEPESIARAKAESLRIAAAFQNVFGQPRGRGEDQKIVLAHLEKCAGDDGNSYRFGEARDGIALVAAGIHRDGARSILRVIERQVARAIVIREPKVKPVGKR